MNIEVELKDRKMSHVYVCREEAMRRPLREWTTENQNKSTDYTYMQYILECVCTVLFSCTIFNGTSEQLKQS